MTHILLAINCSNTRELVALELRELLKRLPLAAKIEETKAPDELTASRVFYGAYHSIIVDAHFFRESSLPIFVTDPSSMGNTLILHLTSPADKGSVEKLNQKGQDKKRTVGQMGRRFRRSLYVCMDRTVCFKNKELFKQVISQGLECYLDERGFPLATRDFLLTKGPRPKRFRQLGHLFFELNTIFVQMRPYLDEVIQTRLCHDFGIQFDVDFPGRFRLPSTDQRMFPQASDCKKWIDAFLHESKDLDPFLIHFTTKRFANGSQFLSHKHTVTSPNLLNGYFLGFHELAQILATKHSNRPSPFLLNADPPFLKAEDPRQRIHVIVCNIDDRPCDALVVPGNGCRPYILLPNEWQCHDREELQARGIAFAAHEGTHAFNEAVIHKLRILGKSAGWEWFDEATAIFNEATILDSCSPGKPLWVEHAHSWVHSPFCSIDDHPDFHGSFSNGVHGFFFLRYLASFSDQLGVSFHNDVWNRCFESPTDKQPSALEIMVDLLSTTIPDVSFSQLFMEYAMRSYAIASAEPLVAERFGLWRAHASHVGLKSGSSETVEFVAPVPLACLYHKFEIVPGVNHISIELKDQLSRLKAIAGWVPTNGPNMVNTVELRPVGNESSLIAVMEDIDSTKNGHFVIVVANIDPFAMRHDNIKSLLSISAQ